MKIFSFLQHIISRVKCIFGYHNWQSDNEQGIQVYIYSYKREVCKVCKKEKLTRNSQTASLLQKFYRRKYHQDDC